MRLTLLATSSLHAPSPRGRWLPLSRELVRSGHQVCLAMTHPTFDLLPRSARQSRVDGVTTIYVAQMHVYGNPGTRRDFGPLALLRVALNGAFALAYAAVRSRAQRLHICKPQPINGLAGLIAARILDCPLHVDCDDYEAGNNRFNGAWQQRIVQFWEDYLPRRASGITVNTRFLAERCRSLGVPAERITYVPNGIAIEQCRPPDPRRVAGLRAALGFTAEPVILYLGTLSEVSHHVGLLLEAFALLKQRCPHARLLLVGDGDDRTLLCQQTHQLGLGDRVQYVGLIPFDQVALFLALATCSVDPVADTPVARGRSPLKIVESLAAGVPVVTGDVGDRRALLGAGRAGVLVTPGDAYALAEGLMQALSKPELRERCAAGARQQAQAYTWPQLAAQWLAGYAKT